MSVVYHWLNVFILNQLYKYDFALKSKDEPFNYGIGITCGVFFIDDTYLHAFIRTYHYLVSSNNRIYYTPRRERDFIRQKKKDNSEAYLVALALIL